MKRTRYLLLALPAALLGLGAGPALAEQSAPALSAMQKQAKIQTRLQNDPQLKNNHIQVTYDNREVTLKGTVDSDAEKARAAQLARVKGVDRVENELEVANQRGVLVDPAIEAKLRAQYTTNNVFRGSDIQVDVDSGVVTLKGTVPSEAVRQQALEAARSAGDVVRVDDNLRVVGQK